MSDIYEGFEASALRTVIADLQAEVARKDNYIEVQRGIIKMHAETIEKAGDLIKPLLEDETIDPTSQLGKDIMDTLDIDLTQDVDISVTMTWKVRASIPSQYDPQEWADEQDWNAEFDDSIATFQFVTAYPDIEVSTY